LYLTFTDVGSFHTYLGKDLLNRVQTVLTTN